MIRARSRSVKHRSSRSFDVVFTPRSRTPWLRTSRKPKSKNVRDGLRHQRRQLVRVVDVRVHGDRHAALPGLGADALHPLHHVGLQEVLRQPHQSLGGQADVADVLDVEQRQDELLQVLDRQVRDVTARDHHVADRRRPAQVLQHLSVAVFALRLELVLGDGRRRVADQVHPRAVPAVLRARGEHLRQHLGRVPVGESLDCPHIGLVEAVALRVRMRRPVGVALAERRRHVAAHRVGTQLALVHRVHHLGRDQHRHRGALEHVALDVGRQVVGEVVAERCLELLEVLDGMGALPLRALPLLGGDVLEAGQARPVGLGPLALERIRERLLGRVGVRLAVPRPVGRPLRASLQGAPRKRLPREGHVLVGQATVLVGRGFGRAHIGRLHSLSVGRTGRKN